MNRKIEQGMKESTATVWKVAKYTALLPIYLLSFLIPKKSVWVMTSGNGKSFEGNTKYLFLYLQNRDVPENVVWITKDRALCQELRVQGYTSHYYYSLKAVYYSLRSEKAFVTHSIGSLIWWSLGSAEVVNLWHGIPLKKIEWDTEEYQNRSRIYNIGFKYIIGKFTNICITSENQRSVFESAFEITEHDIVTTGYPRNDVFYNNYRGKNIDSIPFEDSSEFQLAYVPTWRKNQPAPLDGWGIDLELLDEFLMEQDARMIIKLHPLSEISAEHKEYSNIDILDKSGDIYPSLSSVDCLVTDYSSIFFDFLHVNEPIVFFPYDLKRYKEQRGFYYEYEEVVPGPVVKDSDEFFSIIKTIIKGSDNYVEERETVKESFFDNADGHSAKRIYENFSS